MSTTVKSPKKISPKVKRVSAEDFSTRFGYELSVGNTERGKTYDGVTGREVRSKQYKPRLNVLFRSSIIWDGSDAVYEDPENTQSKLISGHRAGKQIIRYYDGCSSLFEDEQPKDKDVIENLVKSTKEQYFIDGFLYVYGHDDMLKFYLDICSWNENSPYRVPTVTPVFKALDTERSAEEMDSDADRTEQAMAFAKKAAVKKMMVHGNFLGIPMVDEKTQMPLSEKAIRAHYRTAAIKNPKEFLKTYNDETLQVKLQIQRLMDEGEIDTKIIPNQAAWKSKGVAICDISGLTSRENILNKLIDYASSEAGAGFKEMLDALYK